MAEDTVLSVIRTQYPGRNRAVQSTMCGVCRGCVTSPRCPRGERLSGTGGSLKTQWWRQEGQLKDVVVWEVSPSQTLTTLVSVIQDPVYDGFPRCG